ncbi:MULTISPECIES: phosphoribosylformylglycinamidine synthase subunit PurL [Corynebacterium]|jgi:phosphoribosylformylglycinamidine synthase subunit PurL|uniref:Phosphoribosylformylglycinamidine synthase subunit PurL n=2 Tax=Corynebacterium TaxID=1716 RepID=A0AAP4BYM6_9CORY|nr:MULTISPECIES: phosphoribosylformylglycinamidine synthase subunit PurL [Corynebacterium]ERS38978.1 phosphoribosylformylglycinamidine synthase 2 [Corynebacterium sp. KPL1996]ERS44811.1 phosphoribosylformylglycinamidine synthase 2 [Corynebacterium sp. KPL1986]ERS69433.1 phosphoribosylformylglycinamidine synthase 2 [Corynebacterium sp. KPL2004]ERS69776.1 phosphoribosylformylglycinamidine synthase 2 [Corynebacterium sp. KPL1998]MCT1410722.1 phosphoribosylformylglycinamidine synthase subunit PurL
MTVSNDTVDKAQSTPDEQQPYVELGLKDDEYQRIHDILGRRPTDAELTMYSVMWSEHCSYKSSKTHLRYFGETMTEEMGEKILAGIGENAGVVDIGDGNAVTFRVESHNHPSYVEPYQGAATGVGGIVRDIMAMGARPIAVMDQLRFGPADAPDTKRVLPGVVSGVGGYGNSLGLPNIGGETVFDETYAGNPLVNALCVGTLKVDDLKLAFASGTGNKVMLFGSRTGLDGIGGVSVLASDTFEDGAERKLPAVQVGDPFAEKVLIECCLDLYHAGVVVGIQDLGGAGLACATSELAASGDGGMEVNLDAVPLRAENMTAAEILASESQERMCAVVAPENVEKFREICEHWEVTCAEIGEVTEGDHLVIRHQGEVVVDAPAGTIADEAPVYERPYARPEWQDELQKYQGTDKRGLVESLQKLISSPSLCSRDFIMNQYDRYVRGNTVQSHHADAGVLRIDEETGRGVAVSADASGRYTKLDPNMGARLALAEAYRNVAVTGAKPVAITNCLNYGSPENPDVMWQFRESVHGLADAAVELSIPVSGGNVSFYNQTGSEPILPTPVVGVLGVIDDVHKAIGNNLGTVNEKEVLIALGETKDEFGGSIWQLVSAEGADKDNLNGLPPQVDMANEKRLADFFHGNDLLTAAHDVSEGGLAVAAFEMAKRAGALADAAGLGLDLDLTAVHEDAFTAAFSESASRVLVATTADRTDEVLARAAEFGIPATIVGETTNTGALTLGGESVAISQLVEAWSATLPDLFGHAVGANSVVE